jgi:glycosyltransferase involved in cell wall biosynthesis
MMPVVSIVMPTYNRLQFLPMTIQSVMAQSFQDWELLIADDGSDSNTRDYLRTLSDPRIKILWHEHCGRPAIPSNAAIRAARGAYVAFLDSDDVWLPEKLRLQIASLARHPTRQWSYTRFAVIDAEGRLSKSTTDQDRPAHAGWLMRKLLQEEVIIAQPTVLVARPVLAEIGGFDETLAMCYDDDLWFRLAGLGEIDAVDQVLTLVRRHSQHSGNDMQAWRDRRSVFEKTLSANRGTELEPVLRKLRAEMSAGLAKSHARYGSRFDAFTTLITTLPHLWRYPPVWLGALWVAAYRFAPQAIKNRVRRR